ncbi:hypothetical protein PUMCH_000709 [Australozyma saopauloensis]|uniref:thioredoxin-dependent peroxiredoxin n=1 Tax=Australozyma saopauloensis TaxID=291208 RepID=A0AAX4H4M4_9ASCO|nr:hypothetical protein PUMCH_000709 [[Candida] saopauloensis]
MPELRRSTRRAAAEAPAEHKPKVEKSKVTKKAPKKAKLTKKTASKDESESEQAKEEELDEKPQSKNQKKELEVGDEIPDILLVDEKDEPVYLKKVAAESKYLVIFAYPRASTPGCTRQACGFQRNYADFQKLDTQVFGLSSDSTKAQLNFVTKQGLKYHLLSDPKKTLITLLGAKKAPAGIKRSHWVFEDGKLKIKKIQISPEVSVTSALKDVEDLREEKK